MKACTCAQMRKIDGDAMNIGGIPSIILMENAALACVEEIEKNNIANKTIAIFCGKGNNGGDGFAIARHLHMHGAKVKVYLVCGTEYTGDALVNYEIIKRMNLDIIVCDEAMADSYALSADIIVDAIFGTGVRGEITGCTKAVINAINTSDAYTISVDIPSGINGDTGAVCGVCVKADKTVTFGAYKLGILAFPAYDFVGEVVVRDISIPQNIIDIQNININVTDRATAKHLMPHRYENSHKGSYGKVLIIGGSTGMTGAPYLSSQASLISGAGLVTTAIPKSLNNIMEIKLTEAMTLPLDENNGMLSAECIDIVLEHMKKADAILFGPGVGRGKDIGKILKAILSNAVVPVIIDADGLNALADDISVLENTVCEVILTPHTVEMSRLSKKSPEEIENDRIGISREFAKEHNVTLILKGHRTVVTAKHGEQYINITGNSGMATGGSGDVLSGIVTAFSARGLSCVHASALSVYLHGLSGDIAKNKLGADSVTACSIIDNLPYAIQEIL